MRVLLIAGTVFLTLLGAGAQAELRCPQSIPPRECDAMREQIQVLRTPSSATELRELVEGGWRFRQHLEVSRFEVADVPGPGSAVLEKGGQRYFCSRTNSHGMCRPLFKWR